MGNPPSFVFSPKSHDSNPKGTHVHPRQLLEKQQPSLSGYSSNVKSVALAAPVLTWGSPALASAPAQLIYRNLERVESRRAWFDCGQLWKWLCVLWKYDLTPHPLHSLPYPTRRHLRTKHSISDVDVKKRGRNGTMCREGICRHRWSCEQRKGI